MVAAVENGSHSVRSPNRPTGSEIRRSARSSSFANAYVEADEPPFPILYIDESAADAQMTRLNDVKKRRDPDRVARSLAALQDVARGTGNTMVPLLECVRAYATVGEMCDALRTVWGEYEEVPSI